MNVYFRSPLWINGDTKETYFPKELEKVWVEERENPSKNIDYWTKLEHQYAGMAMQGLLSNPYIADEIDKEGIVTKPLFIAEMATAYAHALVEKMKEERKGENQYHTK